MNRHHLSRFPLISFISLISLILFSVTPVLAQTPTFTITIDSVHVGQYPGVLVYVTVRDANGVPLVGLKPENFEINEDRAPKTIPITNIETQINTNSGIWAVMVMDVSGSMGSGTRMADAKTAASRFLDVMTDKDRVAMYAFATTVNLDKIDPAREITFSNNKKPLYDFIEKLQPGGSTPLYDAAYKSVLMLKDVPLTEPRAILLFTDGYNEGSQHTTVDTAVTEAQRRAIPIFTIGLGEADITYIKELARRTGGEYQAAADSTALAGLFQGVAKRLKTQHVLSYVSTLAADGKTHRVNVKVTVNGVSASAEKETSAFPIIPTETATPAPTATARPTVTPTLVPTPIPTPTLYEQFRTSTDVVLRDYMIYFVFVLLGLALTVFRNAVLGALKIFYEFLSALIRRMFGLPPTDSAPAPKPKPTGGEQVKCGKCGNDLTGTTGACSVCGSTKRTKVPRL